MRRRAILVGGGAGKWDQYANYWAPLTRKRHTMPHPALPQHTNYWAPRPWKRHQQELRPQRPTESSHPTQHAKGRTGDCPGPRKETTTRRNVTQGGTSPPSNASLSVTTILLSSISHAQLFKKQEENAKLMLLAKRWLSIPLHLPYSYSANALQMSAKHAGIVSLPTSLCHWPLNQRPRHPAAPPFIAATVRDAVRCACRRQAAKLTGSRAPEAGWEGCGRPAGMPPLVDQPHVRRRHVSLCCLGGGGAGVQHGSVPLWAPPGGGVRHIPLRLVVPSVPCVLHTGHLHCLCPLLSEVTGGGELSQGTIPWGKFGVSVWRRRLPRGICSRNSGALPDLCASSVELVPRSVWKADLGLAPFVFSFFI